MKKLSMENIHRFQICQILLLEFLTHTKGQVQRKIIQCLPITLSLDLTNAFILPSCASAGIVTERIRRCYQQIIIESIVPIIGSAIFTFATKASESTSRKQHHLVHRAIAVPPLSVLARGVFSRLFSSTTYMFCELRNYSFLQG